MPLDSELDLRPQDAVPVELPANMDAEQSLLGILLYDNGAFERVDDFLRPEHFAEPWFGEIYSVIAQEVRKSRLAEPLLIAEKLAHLPAFEEMGGIRYLATLVDQAPPSSYAADYARVIRDHAIRRELIRVAGEVDKEARRGNSDLSAKEQIEAAEQALYSLAETGVQQGGFRGFDSVLTGALEAASRAYERDGKLSGLATGINALDAKLGGLHASDLIIVAGRPSMGKSALGLNIGFEVAKHYSYRLLPDGGRETVTGGIVAVFSLEMSGEQLGTRILAEVSGVPSDKIRRGEIKPGDYGRIADAAALINSIPLHTDDTGALSIGKLCARARRLKRTIGLDLIVVDYLQLVTPDGRKNNDNRTQEVSAITQALKALAKELSVPVVALAQLSRKVEDRDDKRPQLADLRESGSIEQDADVVIFIFREEYYLARTEPEGNGPAFEQWQSKMTAARGKAELIIGKQRHGPIGTVRVSYDADLTKFGNLAKSGDYAGARMDFGGDD